MSRRRRKVSSWLWHIAFVFMLGCSFLPLTPCLWLWDGSVGGRAYSHLLSQINREHLILGRNRQERFSSHSLPLHCKCQCHTVVCEDSGAFCISDPIQAVEEPNRSSAGRYLPRVERNAILSLGMPQPWKNRLDTSMWRVSKWGDMWKTTPLAVLRSLKYFEVRLQS